MVGHGLPAVDWGLNLGELLPALRAHNVTDLGRVRIRRAIWQRLRQAPLSFLWPAPDAR
jgi:site-specific recombinase